MDFPSFLNRSKISIYDNSTNQYRIAVYPNCENCCNFTSLLTILKVSPELLINDIITLTCVERLAIEEESLTQRSTSKLSE